MRIAYLNIKAQITNLRQQDYLNSKFKSGGTNLIMIRNNKQKLLQKSCFNSAKATD
jgi:hypothetical protein